MHDFRAECLAQAHGGSKQQTIQEARQRRNVTVARSAQGANFSRRGDALASVLNVCSFKPAAGFGSKAAYRGDKVTKRVWEEIAAGTYVAQALVAPSERSVSNLKVPIALKVDVRNYAYAGAVKLVAARLYQGQTTNFRTPGGGFAPVLTSRSV